MGDARKKLKAYLVQEGIKQFELGGMINMHKTRINGYLNNMLNLPDYQVEALCAALDINYEKYMNGEIERN